MDDFTVYETKVKLKHVVSTKIDPPNDWDPYQEITEKLKDYNTIILSGSIKDPQYRALNLYQYVNDYYASCIAKYNRVSYDSFSDYIEDDIVRYIQLYIDENPDIIDNWLLCAYDDIISAVRCIEDMPSVYVERKHSSYKTYVEPHLRDYPSQIVHILGRKHIWKFVELWHTTCNKLKYLGEGSLEYKKESTRLFVKTSIGSSFVWELYDIKYHSNKDYYTDAMWHHRDVDNYIQKSL